jgi:hypothetical protein
MTYLFKYKKLTYYLLMFYSFAKTESEFHK